MTAPFNVPSTPCLSLSPINLTSSICVIQIPFSSFVSPPSAYVENVLPLPLILERTPLAIWPEEVTTVTVQLPPTTITEFITIYPTSTVTTTTSDQVPPAVTPPPTESPAKLTWKSRGDMKDLSDFGITKLVGPKKNMEIVSELPPTSASNKSISKSKSSEKNKVQATDDAEAVLRIFYPKGSIDPAKEPRGGAQFYASPIDISRARNVSFAWSVFFPQDFDWVRGGKLPGLYGGKESCSGGDEALDCFSTRLMWRAEGVGELYLYAPKNKQTHSLCSDPRSTCDAAYGFSIGRGSFRFAAGSWTKVSQTVVINTPGKQDGSFSLDVNGRRVIERNDIYYRGSTTPTSGKDTKKHSTKKTGDSPTKTHDGQGILDPIIGGLFGPFAQATAETPENTQESSDTLNPWDTKIQLEQVEALSSTPGHHAPVRFVGIFFSTFFGGHEKRFATPKDQYTWFKGFSLDINE